MHCGVCRQKVYRAPPPSLCNTVSGRPEHQHRSLSLVQWFSLVVRFHVTVNTGEMFRMWDQSRRAVPPSPVSLRRPGPYWPLTWSVLCQFFLLPINNNKWLSVWPAFIGHGNRHLVIWTPPCFLLSFPATTSTACSPPSPFINLSAQRLSISLSGRFCSLHQHSVSVPRVKGSVPKRLHQFSLTDL